MFIICLQLFFTHNISREVKYYIYFRKVNVRFFSNIFNIFKTEEIILVGSNQLRKNILFVFIQFIIEFCVFLQIQDRCVLGMSLLCKQCNFNQKYITPNMECVQNLKHVGWMITVCIVQQFKYAGLLLCVVMFVVSIFLC
eukprot:TRINITY_DN9323_c0_g3_i1.p4 TRINITY_DN9323_c0_g3~~TRINITY_DN9323_c0_g3_i1.p4  ORF type:complete len:140 (-),score=1.96 TRINITY_DN9323_c0_g3_i1:111-530(-)